MRHREEASRAKETPPSSRGGQRRPAPAGYRPSRKLDLTTARERLGEHWPRYEQAVYRFTEKIIADIVGDGGSCTRDRQVFTIQFDAGSDNRADALYNRIVERVSEHLFGTGTVPELTNPRTLRGAAPRRATRKTSFLRRLLRLFSSPLRGSGRNRRRPDDAAELTPPNGTLSDEQDPSFTTFDDNPETANVVTENRRPEAAPPDHAPMHTAAPARGSRIRQHPASQRQSDSRPRKPPAEVVSHRGGPVASAPSGTGSSKTRTGSTQTMAGAKRPNPEEIRRIERAILDSTLSFARSRLRDPDSVEAMLANVRFTYQPMWSPRNRAIFVHFCTPFWEDGRQLHEGNAVISQSGSDELKATLDQLALSRAMVDLEMVVQRDNQVVIAVPIHFASFVNDWSANQIIKLCQSIPEAGRQRIIFKMVDAIEGRADHRLAGVIRQLQPYCRRIGAALPLRSRDIAHWKNAGFKTVVVLLNDAVETEDELVTQMDRFYMAARREGLLSVAHGLKSRSLILAAASIGFDLVHGQPISSAAYTGEPIYMPFDLQNLYDDLIQHPGELEFQSREAPPDA